MRGNLLGGIPDAPALVDWRRFDAALFDLDGVITQSAKLHARAWKEIFDGFLKTHSGKLDERFVSFDVSCDYAQHVDGKSRLEGIRSFLDARGIDLPEGTADASPEATTIHALAKRKNAAFLRILADEGVDVYLDAMALLDALPKLGCRTAIISSSRNCEAVLDAAGLSGNFEVKIDGIVAEALNLRGKPAPDTFVEAARQLAVSPGRAVVIEDSIAGVKAGRAGGFGLVIGVDRVGSEELLLNNGADRVVTDLVSLVPDHDGDAGVPLDVPPSALDDFDELANRVGNNRVALFLDYDGTLTPIVSRPELAVLDEGMRSTIRRLSELCPVIVISGRALTDVMERVGIDNIIYTGSHGFEIAAPDGREIQHEVGSEHVPLVNAAAHQLENLVGHLDGVIIEDKTYTVAVHYRLASPASVHEVERAVEGVLAAHSGLTKISGKKVFELRPDIPWDKGRALLWLLQRLGLDTPDVTPIYIGDDVTDRDAFRVLARRGIGILVAPPERTCAHYRLADTVEVQEYLYRLIDLLAGDRDE
ncbi:MAG: trehalose-phosphatase [Hyphomicrobiaceae bacterium]